MVLRGNFSTAGFFTPAFVNCGLVSNETSLDLAPVHASSH